MTETREYPVPLTEEELKTAAEFVGLIHKSIQEKDAAFGEIRQEYKASIKELRSGLAAQLEKLSTRREVREVELEIVFNSPEKGMKQIFLNSTGALIDTVEMTADDEQDLFADAESRSEEESSESGEEESDLLAAAERSADGADDDKRRRGVPFQSGNCHKCKNYETFVFHLYGEPICLPCLEKRNKPYLDKLADLEGHWSKQDRKLEFRVACYRDWDTTVFTFMLPSGAWGNPIAMPGDFECESSQAALFLTSLFLRGFERNFTPGIFKNDNKQKEN